MFFLSSVGVLLFHPLQDGADKIPLPSPEDLWNGRNWTWELSIVLPLFACLVWYMVGVVRREAFGRLFWQHAAFLLGWLSLGIALISPLHRLGDVLFSAHMLQHEILVLISAPLLAAAHPGVTFLYAFDAARRRVIGRSFSALQRNGYVVLMTSPLAAWLAHAAALWLWHIPALYEATLTSDFIHALQHLSFFLTGLLFWSALYGAGRARMTYGAAVFYVFGTAVSSGALGALLTFSTVLWYPIYSTRTAAWHMTPIEDQQLGGLIMWVPSGIVYIVVGVILFARWLRESDDRLRHSTVFADRAGTSAGEMPSGFNVSPDPWESLSTDRE